MKYRSHSGRMARVHQVRVCEGNGLTKRRPPRKQPPRPDAPVEPGIPGSTDEINPPLRTELITAVSQAIWDLGRLSDKELSENLATAKSMVKAIEPKDEIETMLAAQMIATHHVAMNCLARSNLAIQTVSNREQDLKYATKLLSIFSRQVDVLNKHRGKGQQKVTVEYVHVEPGAQAIVGHVETGKSMGVQTASNRPETAGPPAGAIPNNPGVTLDMELPKKSKRKHKS